MVSIKAASLSYLSQQAEPSSGCSQHAPPLSSGLSLGLQQAAVLLGEQQEEDVGFQFFLGMSLIFFNSGISVFVSIGITVFSHLKTLTAQKDALVQQQINYAISVRPWSL